MNIKKEDANQNHDAPPFLIEHLERRGEGQMLQIPLKITCTCGNNGIYTVAPNLPPGTTMQYAPERASPRPADVK